MVERDQRCQVPSLCVGYDADTPRSIQTVAEFIKGYTDAWGIARVKPVRLISTTPRTCSFVYCQNTISPLWLEIIPVKVYRSQQKIENG